MAFFCKVWKMKKLALEQECSREMTLRLNSFGIYKIRSFKEHLKIPLCCLWNNRRVCNLICITFGSFLRIENKPKNNKSHSKVSVQNE